MRHTYELDEFQRVLVCEALHLMLNNCQSLMKLAEAEKRLHAEKYHRLMSLELSELLYEFTYKGYDPYKE